MSLQFYIRAIEEQRENHPFFPKDYYANPLPVLRISQAFHLNSLLSNTNYKYTNTIKRKRSLFKDSKDTIYYEFVDKTDNTNTNNNTTNSTNRNESSNTNVLEEEEKYLIRKWKYIYIGASQLTQTLKRNFLPSTVSYDLTTYSYQKYYPLYPYISKLLITYKQSVETEGNTTFYHPYYNQLQFTNNVVFTKNSSKVLYEYQDKSNTIDYEEELYYSTNRPKGFFISSEIVKEKWKEPIVSFKDYGLPSRLYDLNSADVLDLSFTYYKTTKVFNSVNAWFIYKNNESGKDIILPYSPSLIQTVEEAKQLIIYSYED